MTKGQAAAGLTGGTGFATLIVWLLGRYGVAISAEEGTWAAGLVLGAGAVVARFGRAFCSAVWEYGIFGIVRRIVRGKGTDTVEAPPVRDA